VPIPVLDEVAERLPQPPTPAVSKSTSSSTTSNDSGEESHAAAAFPTSVLRSFPPSAVADDTCSKTKKLVPALPAMPSLETDESSVGSSNQQQSQRVRLPPLLR